MNKGYLILVVVGILFAYFAIHLMKQSEKEVATNKQIVLLEKEKPYAQYYTRDATDNVVLDLSNTSLEKSKEVWQHSSVKDQILQLFPNFDLMKDMVRMRVSDCPFKTYLLKMMDTVESAYFSGRINSFKAKRLLESLK